MTQIKVNILDFDRDSLEKFLIEMGEKKFRAGQILKWIYQQGASDFSVMTNINKSLRAKLDEVAEIKAPEIKAENRSLDGTIKWAFDVGEGQLVEAVYIPEKGRTTLCVSTQVGCAMNCAFCATGHQGFNRNLKTSEIIGQVWRAAERTTGFSPDARNRAIDNVVLMGMGEPLLNLSSVIPAVKLMMDDFAFGLSKRRVTVSTCGIVPGIDRLSEEVDVALAISLHAADDELRNSIVPENKKYGIKEILSAVHRYLGKSKANNGHVTIEYVLISGVNDTPDQARKLSRLLSDTPCKINLIPFNPFEGTEFNKPSEQAIDTFYRILSDRGYTVVTRRTRGDDIKAACGQLAGEVSNRLRSVKDSSMVIPSEIEEDDNVSSKIDN